MPRARAGTRGNRAPNSDLHGLHFLLSDKGQRTLQQLAREPLTEARHLALASELRRTLSQEETHAVLETALLRQRAASKFTRASEMYFTRAALEQASHQTVSYYRAARLNAAGLTSVADLGCGIGGDALALAQDRFVVGVDYNLQRLAMARENVSVYGNKQRFQPLLADLTELPPLSVDAFFADPGRRDERGRRFFAPDDYSPPLSPLLARWLPAVPNGAVKISPGIDYAHLPPDAAVEFISLDGEVKEGVLWFGVLHDGSSRRATLLPSAATISDLDDDGTVVEVTPPAQFLYEPDGAVIRAHLVEPLAQKLGASKIDDDIAYLTSDKAISTPFARCFLIEETMPFHLKRLRARLRELHIGRVVVKKRGSPLSPEQLQRNLDLHGDKEVVLFLTHVQSQPSVLIGREIEPATLQGL